MPPLKQFFIILAAVLIGVLAALFLHDRFIVQPREAARAADVARAAGINLAKAHAEADDIAANLDASVERSVSGARQALDAQADEQDKRRLAAEALNGASMIKVALSEYYVSNGRWPANAQDAGLGAPESFAGGAVSRIDVSANGTIVITLNAVLADGATIRLAPETASPGAVIQWHCHAQGSDALRRYLPACRG